MPNLQKMLNVRIPESVHSKLSQLTEATGRSKSFLAVEALEGYLAQQAWQIAEVKAGIKEADQGDFASDDEVNAIFAKHAS
jgi:RHH-type transcriptional regulator, rel operon repressor / antitoxin RelB